MRRLLPLLLVAGCATTAAEEPAAIPATTTTTAVAPLVQINEISLGDIDAAVAGAQSLVEEFVDPSPGAGVRSANTHTPAPPAAATAPLQPATPTVEPGSSETVWDRIAQCESGGNWSINTGNGHYGGLQFTAQSWHGVGGTGYPHEHSREEQIMRAEKLLALQGWGAWPGCARREGLR